MSDLNERIQWLQLALTRGIGPITFWKYLRQAQGMIEAACSFADELAAPSIAERELLEHERQGFQVVLGKDSIYPRSLRQLRDAPPFLSVAGDLTLLQRHCIAIVGARNASLQGKAFAAKLAHDLGRHGIVIVSGMARGIDAAAHEGSLETGSVAVLAGGLDVIYPPENQGIYKTLQEKGLLLTEMRLGTTIEPALFPRRNRLIAGLVEGVILVEAAVQSGSLITAQYALDLGREIFAVPGFPADPRSTGCNSFLKQGAVLVESAEDVLRTLQMEKPRTAREPNTPVEFTNEGPLSKKDELLQALSNLPISIEILFQSQSCSLPHLLNMLTELELEGKVQRYPNGDVALR